MGVNQRQKERINRKHKCPIVEILTQQTMKEKKKVNKMKILQ